MIASRKDGIVLASPSASPYKMKKLGRILFKSIVLFCCATLSAMLGCYIGSGGPDKGDVPMLCGHNTGMLWLALMFIGGLVVLVSEYQRRHED
jgi:hypothetical protein